MKKKELVVVRSSENSEEIYKKFIQYLQRQGLKIVKGEKNEKR